MLGASVLDPIWKTRGLGFWRCECRTLGDSGSFIFMVSCKNVCIEWDWPSSLKVEGRCGLWCLHRAITGICVRCTLCPVYPGCWRTFWVAAFYIGFRDCDVVVEWVCVQYLDENKQLILAILDNQNLGKLNECATYAPDLPHLFLCLGMWETDKDTSEMRRYGGEWSIVDSHRTRSESGTIGYRQGFVTLLRVEMNWSWGFLR